MKSVFIRSIVFSAVIFAASSSLFAQVAASNGPMFIGETLTYDGKINKILRGISVAELTFAASAGPGANQLLIKTEAVSKGTLLKWLKYSFLQQYESTVDLATFRIVKTVKHDVQKERVRDSEALFDYKEKSVRYVETDPKDPNRPPRRIASEITGQMNDMMSAIYATRLLPLSVGKRFEFQVSDSGLVYRVPFVVAAREQQKTILGKVWCFRIEPEIFGRDRLIEQKGKMVIWVTDDARHTPVRAQINSEYGKIDVKLKTVSAAK